MIIKKKTLLLPLVIFGAVFLWSGQARGADYYFDATSGSDRSLTGNQAAPYKTWSKLKSVMASASSGDRFYLKRGETWTFTAASDALTIPTNTITIDAYGTGEKPKINGGGYSVLSHPTHQTSAMISIGETAPSSHDVWIKNLEVYNSGAANGIRYSGTYASRYYLGGGGITGCYIHDIGEAAIYLYRIPSNEMYGAIEVSNNEINAAVLNGNPATYNDLGPQAVNAMDGYTSGHIFRGNTLIGSFGEGVGCTGFAIVEDNVISETGNPGLYVGSTRVEEARTVIVRNNIVFGSATETYENSKSFQPSGIRFDVEGGAGTGTYLLTVIIYGNVVINYDYGIDLRVNPEGTGSTYVGVKNNLGKLSVFNNTVIDCKYNFVVFRNERFDDADVFNNSSVIFNDSSSVCAHFLSYTSTWPDSGSAWTWGSNHFYGDNLAAVSPWYVPTGTLPDITGSPAFSKTSDWRSLASTPVKAQYSPQAGSALINAGGFPATYSGKSSNTLTGVTNGSMFYPGDEIRDDEKRPGTVVSATATTVTLTNASAFDATGSLFPTAWSGSAPDMGAAEYFGGASAPSAPGGLSVR